MTLSIKLLNTHTITFTRAGEGYPYNGQWVEAVPTSVPDVKGSLQPVRSGERQRVLPEGNQSDSAYFFYTKTKLIGTSQFNDTEPDTCVIDNRTYEVNVDENWQPFGLMTDHYKYILIGRSPNEELE